MALILFTRSRAPLMKTSRSLKNEFRKGKGKVDGGSTGDTNERLACGISMLLLAYRRNRRFQGRSGRWLCIVSI